MRSGAVWQVEKHDKRRCFLELEALEELLSSLRKNFTPLLSALQKDSH